MNDLSLHVDGTRDYAQGEVFLLNKGADALEAVVYNSTGFGPVSADAFEAIDVVKLAADTGFDVAWKNPRRFLTMDAITVQLVDEPRKLGGVDFNCMAKMKMPANFNPSVDQSALAYHPDQIKRVSKWEFGAGKPVFLLRSPEDVTWVMQTYTNANATGLTIDALPHLADQLDLPEGWRFKAQTLEGDLVIDTNGLANIVPDKLANMYQGCIDGVNNFDPWTI